MHETSDDIATLQQLLDRSVANAGSHLKSMFSDPPPAATVAAELGGIFEVHFATVTPSGAPNVAPIDALFYGGHLWIGVPAKAARASFLRRDQRVSVSYTRGESFCAIIHGRAVKVQEDDPALEQFRTYSDGEYVKLYSPKWLEWIERQGRGEQYRVDAHKIFVKT